MEILLSKNLLTSDLQNLTEILHKIRYFASISIQRMINSQVLESIPQFLVLRFIFDLSPKRLQNLKKFFVITINTFSFFGKNLCQTANSICYFYWYLVRWHNKKTFLKIYTSTYVELGTCTVKQVFKCKLVSQANSVVKIFLILLLIDE